MWGVATTYPIGIDLNDGCLTAAQFRKGHHGPHVRGFLCLPLTAALGTGAGEEALANALKGIRSCGFFGGRRVALNLPLQDLSFFPVQFPVKTPHDPEEGILSETSKLLSYPLEEAMIDYSSLLQIRETWHATVLAVRRKVVEHWLATLGRAGFRVEVMDFSMGSLARLHRRLYVPTDRADIICHLGRTGIMLVVMSGEGIITTAEIPWGVEFLRGKVETNLALQAGDTTALKVLSSYGLGYMDRQNITEASYEDGGNDNDDRNMYRAVFQILSPTVNGLAYECQNLIGYVRSVRESAVFGTIYLYGLAGLISHLGRYLEEQVEIPVEVVDLGSHLDFSGIKGPGLHSGDISPAPALGLALRDLPWL